MKNLFENFVNDFDFAENTKKAFLSDLRNFVEWYSNHNKEPFAIHRTTARDVIDFRNYLQKTYAVSTANRCLVAMRRFFQWCVDQNMIASNPVAKVKEIRQQGGTAPKSLEQNQIRKILKEVELRGMLRCIPSN